MERKVSDNGSGESQEICKKCKVSLKSALKNHQINGQLTRVEEEAEQLINGSSYKRQHGEPEDL